MVFAGAAARAKAPHESHYTTIRHFAGEKGLFLIAVDADALGDALRFEPSRDGALFPHLYGELDFAAVTEVIDLPVRSDGTHIIPELSA
jgi:uncharacterized protein (DUF952 family)